MVNSIMYENITDNYSNNQNNQNDIDNEIQNEGYSEYKIGICELYHPYYHGSLEHLSSTQKKELYGSYLCFQTLYDDELYDDEDLFPHDGSGPWGISTHRVWPEVEHPFIRNYTSIIQTYNVDIFVTYTKNGTTLCIPKTFWLRLFQRKCKNYYKQLQKRIQRAKNPRNLMSRQIYGHQL